MLSKMAKCMSPFCTLTWQLECPEIETPLSPHTGQTDRLTAPAQSMSAATQGHTLLRTHTHTLAQTHALAFARLKRATVGGVKGPGEQLIVDYLLITSADRLCME